MPAIPMFFRCGVQRFGGSVLARESLVVARVLKCSSARGLSVRPLHEGSVVVPLRGRYA